MSELNVAALTAFFGVLVFVSGQIFLSLFLEPIKEHRKLRSEIIFAWTFYANVSSGIANDDEKEKTQRRLRLLASKFRANAYLIPFHWFFALFRIVHSRNKMLEISTNLIGWSNTSYRGDGSQKRDNIKKLMNFRTND
jgi:hypothetical protein